MLKESCGYYEPHTDHEGLNPYFNGTCSKRDKNATREFEASRLNPYFNGTCSKSQPTFTNKSYKKNVLILILMEHAQRVQPPKVANVYVWSVLILILMEHAQRDMVENEGRICD